VFRFSANVLLQVPACEDHTGKGHLIALMCLRRVRVPQAKTYYCPPAPTPPPWQHTAYSHTAHQKVILKQVSYLLYKALQGTVKCLYSLTFNILLYKASIYNEKNAYGSFALGRFNGKDNLVTGYQH